MRKWTILFLLMAVVPAGATVRYVSPDGTGNFTTIQNAINGSVDGDTIIVRGDMGVYNENPNVDRRLAIFGQGNGCNNVLPTRLDGSLQFAAGSSNSVVAGFYIYNFAPISLSFGVTGIAVRRCRIESWSGQVCLLTSSNNSLVVEESMLYPSGGTARVVNINGSNTSVSLANCILSGADNTCVGFYNITASNTVTVTNCLILNINSVVSGVGGGSWFLDHNIFWQTTWDGNLSAATVSASYNAITSGMTSFLGTNNITITSNPFVSWSPPHDVCNSNVHLTVGSGLINAGDPNAANDRDGSRRDLGVYGGPLNYEVTGAVDFPFVTFFTATPNVPQGGVLELRTTGRVGRGQ